MKNVVVVQSLSRVLLFVTPWTATCQSSLSFTISWSLLKGLSTELVMPSNHLILCRPLILLPSIFLSVRVFSSESALRIRWPSIGASVSASVLPMNIQDWFPLGLMVWSPCYPTDSWESSPTPQIEGNNSLTSHICTWLPEKSRCMKVVSFIH